MKKVALASLCFGLLVGCGGPMDDEAPASESSSGVLPGDQIAESSSELVSCRYVYWECTNSRGTASWHRANVYWCWDSRYGQSYGWWSRAHTGMSC